MTEGGIYERRTPVCVSMPESLKRNMVQESKTRQHGVNLIINEIPEEYKSDACLGNASQIPSSNFLINEIRKIKIRLNLEGSKNGHNLIFLLINLIIKLIKKFFMIFSLSIFQYPEGMI